MNQTQTAPSAIQFIDLAAQQERIRTDLDRRIAGVLDHGRYIMGPEIADLEQKLAAFCGVKHAISCASGTDALLLPLMAYGVGPGDAVFTTPFTFIATAEVISLLGATPVFVDVERDTFNIDVEKLSETIDGLATRHPELTPRGIIPVDLFGQPADYDEISAIAEKHDLFVIEDAAQSFGGDYKGRRAGAFGNVAATSFFPAKPLGCYGDGGAIFSDDDDLVAIMKSIRVHGQGSDKYDNVRVGLNSRMDTMQAAVLLAKLEIFEDEIRLRQQVADRYSAALSGAFATPVVRDDRQSAWAQYTLVGDDRDGAIARLKAAGIPTAVYYPIPLHLQGAYAPLGYGRGDFPVSEWLAERVFSLPMHPYLGAEQQEFIADALLK